MTPMFSIRLGDAISGVYYFCAKRDAATGLLSSAPPVVNSSALTVLISTLSRFTAGVFAKGCTIETPFTIAYF